VFVACFFDKFIQKVRYGSASQLLAGLAMGKDQEDENRRYLMPCGPDSLDPPGERLLRL
jgi:hypothetical protein